MFLSPCYPMQRWARSEDFLPKENVELDDIAQQIKKTLNLFETNPDLSMYVPSSPPPCVQYDQSEFYSTFWENIDPFEPLEVGDIFEIHYQRWHHFWNQDRNNNWWNSRIIFYWQELLCNVQTPNLLIYLHFSIYLMKELHM